MNRSRLSPVSRDGNGSGRGCTSGGRQRVPGGTARDGRVGGERRGGTGQEDDADGGVRCWWHDLRGLRRSRGGNTESVRTKPRGTQVLNTVVAFRLYTVRAR